MSNGRSKSPLDEIFDDGTSFPAGRHPVDAAVGIGHNEVHDSFTVEDFNALPEVQQAVLEHIKRSARGIGDVRSMFALLVKFSEIDILEAVRALEVDGFIAQSESGSNSYILIREDVRSVIEQLDTERRNRPIVYEG